jgi:molybdopterin converting factor small subunit
VVVTVHLHTTLQRRTPDGIVRRLEITLPSTSCLADVLDQLAIALDEASILLVINGRVAEPGQPLADGDEIHLIPALSGGAPHFPGEFTEGLVNSPGK